MFALAHANVISHFELGLRCYIGSILIDAFQLVSVRSRHVLGLHFYGPMFRVVVIGDQVRNYIDPLVVAA